MLVIKRISGGSGWLSGYDERLRDVKCTVHDPEVIGSHRVDIGVCGSSVQVGLEPI